MRFLSSIVLLFALFSASAQEWSPAHSEDQLNVINGGLNKWKQDEKYPVVKDVFEKAENPRWRLGGIDLWEQVPDSFKDEKEARKMGCRFDYIKSNQEKTGLLKLSYGQGVWIFVYDRDATGKYIKTAVITPPTWYSYASLAFVDVRGPEKPKFILIEHEGGTGTGYNEKIHWLMGWHDGAFHTVFRETVFMVNDQLGEETCYRMNYKMVKGKVPRIETQCNYDQVWIMASPYDFHSKWRDWYFWNEKNFSFYDSKALNENMDRSWGGDFKFRLNLETNRVKILNLPPLPQKMLDGSDSENYWKNIVIQ